MEQPIHEYRWTPRVTRIQGCFPRQASQTRAVGCVLTFESGGVRNIPEQVESIMAISARKPIFIAGPLLSDPAKVIKGPDIRHLLGNVGRPGKTLLVSPPNLPLKPPNRDIRVITHADYDYKRLDHFSDTSYVCLPLNGCFPLAMASMALLIRISF